MYKNGQKVVDTAAGWRGTVDRRPCVPDMLFAGFKITAAVVATALHLLVDRGLLRYDDPVCAAWKEFAQNGKEGVPRACARRIASRPTHPGRLAPHRTDPDTSSAQCWGRSLCTSGVTTAPVPHASAPVSRATAPVPHATRYPNGRKLGGDAFS